MIYRLPLIQISPKDHDLDISPLERRRLQKREQEVSLAARIFKGVNTCINCYKKLYVLIFNYINAGTTEKD